VLKYISEDIAPTSVGKLHGLHLLPTASPTAFCKTFEISAENSSANSLAYYYCADEAEYNLLSIYETTAQRLISNQVPHDIINCMLSSGSIQQNNLLSTRIPTTFTSFFIYLLFDRRKILISRRQVRRLWRSW
jgi:hypothetical protein